MADVTATLAWAGEGLKFDGGATDGPQIRMDGSGVTGPSPMAVLLLAFGGCMAADIVDIASKGRTTMTGLDVGLEADRAAEPPRRFTRVVMRFTVQGANAADEPKFQRALDLSREKYCSVMHTLRSDIDLDFTIVLA